MPSEKNKEKVILEAAASLFTSKGYQATRMEDVAKEAGISKGLTYFYFKNKEDLYLALTRRAFDQFKEVFKEVIRKKGQSGLDQVCDLFTSVSSFAKANQVYFDSIVDFLDLLKKYNDPSKRDSIHPRILESEQFQKLLETHHDPAKLGIRMISQGIKDGSIRPELQPEITFYAIWSMMIGYEKLRGPIGYEEKEIKINDENWEKGYLKLIKDMLKGTVQASKPVTVQGSLF
ncbi:TetR/AcrR family transcriptional regulator [Algoriphagus sediminis]|uniref:TetR/AcrR family transcriptional regulator n=1 Tax=Algoriphagus sediminis TaxID=3057113 RepID=A0ABT7YB02_9BACT|nr:TetR/AcrR family transcriptional regulator [Algoriphagus sediminis]MDN3203694.1 TetR/AcrR family transcriptional regulator [Algoriphagus sediminis]